MSNKLSAFEDGLRLCVLPQYSPFSISHLSYTQWASLLQLADTSWKNGPVSVPIAPWGAQYLAHCELTEHLETANTYGLLLLCCYSTFHHNRTFSISIIPHWLIDGDTLCGEIFFRRGHKCGLWDIICGICETISSRIGQMLISQWVCITLFILQF
jgi:hypothetical protein